MIIDIEVTDDDGVSDIRCPLCNSDFVSDLDKSTEGVSRFRFSVSVFLTD
jgi:hypothetical protein